MGAKESLQRLIDRKQEEIEELESHLTQARVYLQALQDAVKALPKETNGASGSDVSLRLGTIVYRVREMLRTNGKPLHINDILRELGRPIDKDNRLSVAGTLSAYVRNGQVFNRPDPNTFGLIEFNSSVGPKVVDDLPDTFGG